MDQSYKQLEEIRQIQSLKYNKKIEQEQLEEKKLKEISLHEEKLENEKLEQIKAEEQIIKDHQEYLDKRSREDNKNNTEISINHLEDLNDLPINHLEDLNDSLVIINSIFEDSCQDNDSHVFVQETIINPFYNLVNNSNNDDLYTFYISIKEISSTYDTIDLELIFNTLILINMNCQFIKILNERNKLDYVKIIFQEFVKIIDYFKPEFNLF
jgi:hypothetical protein